MCSEFKIQSAKQVGEWFKAKVSTLCPWAHVISLYSALINSPLAAQVTIIPVHSCHAALRGPLLGLVDLILYPKMYMDHFSWSIYYLFNNIAIYW